MAMEAEEQRCGLPSPLPNCSAGRNPGLSSPGPDSGGATRGLAGRGGGGAKVMGPGVGRAARRFCGPGRVKSAPKARATRSGVGGGIPVTAVKGLNLPQVSLSWWNKHLI